MTAPTPSPEVLAYLADFIAYYEAPPAEEPTEPPLTEAGSMHAGMDNRVAFAAQFGPDEGHDEEFDGAGIYEDTLPAGWEWVNKGAAVWRQSFSQGRVDHGGSGSDVYDLHAAVKPLPTGDWTAYSHLVGMVAGTPSYVATLCLYNETNGNFVTFAAYKATETAGIQFFVSHYTAANPTTAATLKSGPKIYPIGPNFYFRLEKTGDTYSFHVNGDGGCWFQVDAGRNLATTLGTPTHIGVAANSQFPCHCGMEWLRIRSA